ncbi:MAG: excinuclease ABC subunit UvrC [Clostridia bacterium]|nr:excinuclease ABC subunit UvrC [Clostridia bacterium]
MTILEKLKTLPTTSGVYVMKNSHGEIIYIGKAKNLKRRVSQYFLRDQKHNKVRAMVEKIADFDYFLTPSEVDALALESNLIKKHQPFYNILLKDGKAFPYLKIDVKNTYPKVEITRRVKNDGAKYFGPYITGVGIHDILDIINYVFPVRKCKNLPKKECLNYSLGLCSAPCINKISSEQYKKIIDEIIDFLNGDDAIVESKLLKRMTSQVQMENFENAIETREKLKMLEKLKQKSVASLPKTVSLDAFGEVNNEFGNAICVLNLRGGKILGVSSFYAPSGAEDDALASFIVGYYSSNIAAPKEILISKKIENIEEIKQVLNITSEIHQPEKGIKQKIVEMAKNNATEFLLKKSSLEERKRTRTITSIQNLKDILKLKYLPLRIECYDISHLHGNQTVASMVVFENGLPAKKQYRKFKIKTVEGIDDFASMAEVLSRRIARFKEDDPFFNKKPDLIVVDGGKGQLSYAEKVVLENNFDCDLISLAEKFEEVFLPGQSLSVVLKRGSPELSLLQNIRDEAHRFAITFHRTLRTKDMLTKTKKKN